MLMEVQLKATFLCTYVCVVIPTVLSTTRDVKLSRADIDPDDPLTYWLRPSGLCNDPDVFKSIFLNSTEQHYYVV